jgi:hypothetical protein
MTVFCSVCGKKMTQGRFALQIGFHQKCNPAEYKEKLNAIKRVERMQHYYSFVVPQRQNKLCSVCGKILRKGGTRVGHSEIIGVHQKCDFPYYQKTWRQARRQRKLSQS